MCFFDYIHNGCLELCCLNLVSALSQEFLSAPSPCIAHIFLFFCVCFFPASLRLFVNNWAFQVIECCNLVCWHIPLGLLLCVQWLGWTVLVMSISCAVTSLRCHSSEGTKSRCNYSGFSKTLCLFPWSLLSRLLCRNHTQILGSTNCWHIALLFLKGPRTYIALWSDSIKLLPALMRLIH